VVTTLDTFGPPDLASDRNLTWELEKMSNNQSKAQSHLRHRPSPVLWFLVHTFPSFDWLFLGSAFCQVLLSSSVHLPNLADRMCLLLLRAVTRDISVGCLAPAKRSNLTRCARSEKWNSANICGQGYRPSSNYKKKDSIGIFDHGVRYNPRSRNAGLAVEVDCYVGI
jgi:hypothetical protein